MTRKRSTRAATLKDVAAACQLSVSTVSRALAQNPAIPESTRKKVRDAARKLSYQPNVQARALQTKRTQTIGLTIPSLVNPYFAELAEAVQLAAAKRGYTTVVANTFEQPEALSDALNVLYSHRVDGIISVPHEDCAEQIRGLAAQIPIVLLDRGLKDCEGPQLCTVDSDPTPGIRAAVAHLHDTQLLPIGYLAGPMDTTTGRERRQAFITACQDLGLSEEEDFYIYPGGYEHHQGFQGTLELLREHQVAAIVAGDSMMTIGALDACHQHGIRIGEELALIGFDDFALFRLQPAPLTIIDQHAHELATIAVEQVVGRIQPDTADGQELLAHERTQTTLILRQSTQCARLSDPSRQRRRPSQLSTHQGKPTEFSSAT